MDLRTIIAQLAARRWWIAASVMLFAAAFAFIAFVSTPVYRASALLVPAGADRAGMSGTLTSALGQLGGLASLAGINVGGKASETEEALAVLQSRQFTEKFINDLNLMPILYADIWDTTTGKWKVAELNQPTPARAFKLFDRIRSVKQDDKKSLVTLQIDWPDRELAATWANELVRRLNDEMRARAIAKADASVGYLERELTATSVVNTRDAITRLIEAQIQQRMLANVTQEFAFRVVDKAMAPDKGDTVRPKRLLLIVAGILFGFVAGISGALVRIAFVELGAFSADLKVDAASARKAATL